MLFAHWNICIMPSEVGFAASANEASTRFMVLLTGSYWNEAVSQAAVVDGEWVALLAWALLRYPEAHYLPAFPEPAAVSCRC